MTEEYRKYLYSKKWRKKRAKVLKRANGICERCKLMRATQVHHKTYKHIFKERLKELEALCEDCHKKEHNLLVTGIQEMSAKMMYEYVYGEEK